jgi:hypothetical protein
MAKKGIEIITTQFTPWEKKIIARYREDIMRSLARNLDNIRYNSIQYIIPQKPPATKKMSPWRMAREQPSTPGKLTDRTGRLIKMLQSKATWQMKRKTMTMGNNYFKGMVKVEDNYRTDRETYSATLRVDIQDGNPLIGDTVGRRLVEVMGENRKMMLQSRVTKQQLFMRFMWEKGIRGERRPFIEPAAQRERFNTSALIASKLRELRSL